MLTMHSQLKMLSVEDLNLPTLLIKLDHSGNVHSMVVPNGSGKLEFSTEETAVEEDSRELKSALVAKTVDKLMIILETVNGMK